jgi:hypothetical protein
VEAQKPGGGGRICTRAEDRGAPRSKDKTVGPSPANPDIFPSRVALIQYVLLNNTAGICHT